MAGGYGSEKLPYTHDRVPLPKGLGDLPRYLNELIGGFFTRFAYILRLVWDTGHWILFLMTFMALFQGVTPVIGSLISKHVLNSLQDAVRQGALPESSFWSSDLFYLLILLFVYRILTQIVSHIHRALNRIAGEKVVRQVKTQIMEKSKTLDIASFDDPHFYERMENASREAGSRPLSILTQCFSVISTLIEFASFLVILLTAPGLSWATLVIMAISIPSAVVNFIYRKKNFQYIRRRSKERRQMDYYSGLLVDKDRIKEVRMYDLADLFIGRYQEAFAVYYKGLRRLIFSENAWHMAIGILSGLTNLAFYLVIARQVFTGQIMIGDYTLYTGAIASIVACINTLINSSGSIYEGTLFIDNLILFMDEPQTVIPRSEAAAEVEKNTGHTIVFDHVSFRYPGMQRDVLHDINLTIRPGETLALVGLNGAGKTTLIKLLTRLYDPTEGRILLDGKDLRDYDLRSLYRTFGIIFQDFGKYAVSVEENIRFGDIHKEFYPEDHSQPNTEAAFGSNTGIAGNAIRDAVRDAAVQSAAHDYIQRLPDGYDTPLMRIFEPNGMELSIGQWQKLAVARAFYSDADILILDEPTASLDPMAEQEIFNQFDALRRSKTTIFVSHRLSSATIADQIVVLEQGRVIENGTHTELMEQSGKYFELFSTQAKRYAA